MSHVSLSCVGVVWDVLLAARDGIPGESGIVCLESNQTRRLNVCNTIRRIHDCVIDVVKRLIAPGRVC